MDESTAHAALDTAERLVHVGSPEEALGEVRNLYGPPLPSAVRGRALALEVVALEDLERAQEARDRIVERMQEEGDNLSFVLAAGMEFSDLEADDHAEIFFRNLCELDPDNYVPHYNLAIALGRTGRYLEAVEAYNRALERNAEFSSAWLQKGYCLRLLGDLENAAAAYRHYLEIEPDDSETWRELGVVASDAGRLEEAYRAFANAIAAGADAEDVWFNWAVTAVQHNDPDQLTKCIDQLRTLNEEGWRLQIALGDLDEANGNLWEAWEHVVEAFEAALEDPEDEAPEFVAAAALRFARRHDMAEHAESIVHRIFEEELFSPDVLEGIQWLEGRYANNGCSYQVVLRIPAGEGDAADHAFRVYGVTATSPDNAAEIARAFEARCGNPGGEVFAMHQLSEPDEGLLGVYWCTELLDAPPYAAPTPGEHR